MIEPINDHDAALDDIRRSPKDEGVLEMIVRRPQVNARERLQEAELDSAQGLVGDRWSTRRNPNPETQLTLVNARLMAAVAGDKDRWPLAGDQLFVDLDLSVENLPPGTRIALGTATIEITETPHTGCGKFASRFGAEAVKFVNAPAGKQLRLRGVYARVVSGGVVRPGDAVRKLARRG